ncbi:MAG: tetratricopeptide repeat protein [Alphaproteobacteria bacterium]|nr:tetratricopeptide repeat protein [Alphaproteobacteria bacterium]
MAASAQQTQFETALKLHLGGQAARAEALYREILRAAPHHFPALYMLGTLKLQQGAAVEAETLLAQAVAMKPEAPEARLNHGLALKMQGRFQDAMARYDEAIALKPDYVNAHLNRGTLLQQIGRLPEALASFDRAVALSPADADAHYNRGNALEALQRYDEAIRSYERAIALKPAFAEAFAGLGNILRQTGQMKGALAAYDRAIELNPLHADCLNNRGTLLHGLGQFDAAIKDYARALTIVPSLDDARFNMGLTRLLLGDWARGFEGYELRWKKRANAVWRPDHPAPDWHGDNLSGRHLLLFGEQGAGDTIMAIRFVPALVAGGARVTVLAPKRLHRLLRTVSPDVAFADSVAPDDAYDLQLPLMSLPRVLGVRPGLRMTAPYLSADEARAKMWRARLGTQGFKVGLCWQGNPSASIDVGRSIPLAQFTPMAKIDGIRLISLQKLHGLEQIERAALPLEQPNHDFDGGPDAFVDTAAMMMHLDLVVTSDTAIAHLAGALGRPVFTVLKDVPDWRWLLEREDTPWYPTMRLFRQTRAGDWSGPIREVAAAVEALARQRHTDGASKCA